MATIAIVDTKLHRGSHKWFWETLAQGDDGGVLDANGGSVAFADKTVQITGTFGGATIVIEGSNDGTNFGTLNDNTGASLSFTAAAGPVLIAENPLAIRPTVSGGDCTTDLDVTIVVLAEL